MNIASYLHAFQPRAIQAQGTTVDRTSSITEEGQRRWFGLVDKLRQEHIAEAAKHPDPNGLEYEPLLDHFTVNFDEVPPTVVRRLAASDLLWCQEGFLANAGSKAVIGWKGKRKSEKIRDDSRLSITALRTGSAAGHKAPSYYFLEGQRVRGGYDSKFLEKHGAPPGSSVRRGLCAAASGRGHLSECTPLSCACPQS